MKRGNQWAGPVSAFTLFWVCSLWTSAGFAAGVEPGVARWHVKTTIQQNKKLKKVGYDDLVKLDDPPGASRNNKNYQRTHYPSFQNSLGLSEGDVISVRGYVHLVARERDGDYHIQISASPSDGGNCMIIEVPMNDEKFVAQQYVRSRAADVRAFVRDRMLKGKEPSTSGNVMRRPPYVEVKGKLFFDDWHVPDRHNRGKKGMKCPTLWEVHPITGMWFAAIQ